MDLPVITHPEQDFNKLKNKSVSIVAFLDTVRPRTDDTYTIRLRVIFQRFPKYYTTKLNASKSDWYKISAHRPKGDLREQKIIIHELLRKALTIIYELDSFSFDEFEKRYTTKHQQRNDVFAMYKEYIDELQKDGRVGNKTVYEYSLKSLMDFVSKIKLPFTKVTPRFLANYERYMLSLGKSETTIAMYLRCLRFLCKNAIRNGQMKNEQYPFGKYRYQLPQPGNIKKALRLGDIGKIYHYQPEDGSPEHYYRDLWLFSYFCNGINMKDIGLLKYKDIEGEHIYYRRSKTSHTNRKSKPIDVILSEEVKAIIEKWGNKPNYPENYIFPVLIDGLSAEQIQARIKQVTKQTNKYIKRIAEKVGITDNVSTYTARHSYATVLKRSGVNISFISEALGHTNLKTTESYLDSFEDDQKKEAAKNLTAW
jgi:integrase